MTTATTATRARRRLSPDEINAIQRWLLNNDLRLLADRARFDELPGRLEADTGVAVGARAIRRIHWLMCIRRQMKFYMGHTGRVAALSRPG
jgi:hypothetical protein